MQKVSVESSMIKSVGYDAFSSVLEVEFENGQVYQYAKVAPRTYNAFMKSKSKGGFLTRSIKDKYDYRKVLNVEDTQINRQEVSNTVHVLAPAR